MSRPHVLLLDEPSLGLAPDPRPAGLRDDPRDQRQGTTILLVEQNALQALSIANRGVRPADRRGRPVGAGERADPERDGPQGVPRRAVGRTPQRRRRPSRTADDRGSRSRPTGEWRPDPVRGVRRRPVASAAGRRRARGRGRRRPRREAVGPAARRSRRAAGRAGGRRAVGSRHGTGSRLRPVAATSTEARAATATDKAVELICLDPGTWRTATIEQWHADQTVRVWRAVDPGPRPARPTHRSTSCPRSARPCRRSASARRPSGRIGRPVPRTVDAWRLDGDVATPIALRLMAPLGAISGLGALFAPPLDAGPSWPSGVYVFRHTVLASKLARWFAVEVRTDGPVPEPSPGRRHRSCSRAAASERSSCPDRRGRRSARRVGCRSPSRPRH